MKFELTHRTIYKYPAPVADGVTELRINPLDGDNQKVLWRKCEIEPKVPVHHFDDTFGNRVEYFAVPFRHSSLKIVNRAAVVTQPPEIPEIHRSISLAEAKQIYNRHQHWMFFYTHPSQLVPKLEKNLSSYIPKLNSSWSMEEIGMKLVSYLYEDFEYKPGSTDISTSVQDVLLSRQGVCQDFAHVMLAILRHWGIPARYVSGYIEAHDPTVKKSELRGAVASHAWVEILLPGNLWWGLDPTNNQPAGERHIRVAVGRDFNDVSPVRGSFRGGQGHHLQVEVELKRI